MTELTNKFESIIEQMNVLKAEYKTTGKQLLKEVVRDFFEKHANIVKSFSWTQYTPYWNDGDPCTFGVYSMYIQFQEDKCPEELVEYIGDAREDKVCTDSFYYLKDKTVSWYTDLNEIDTLIHTHESLCQDIFGDNVEVFVTPDTVYTESYDHD